MQPPSTDPEAITVKAIPHGELEEFAAGCIKGSHSGRVNPISSARLHSQLHNPCATDDDIVMIAAMCGSICVGYHGLLPGYYLYGGTIRKVFWATTFFVAPEMRGRGVGKQLVEAILQLGIDFAVTRMTEGAEGAYRSMGLQTLGYHEYRQLRADKLRRLLPGAAPSGSTRSNTPSLLKGFLEVQSDTATYPAARRSLYAKVLRSIGLTETLLTYEEVEEIGDWQKNHLDRATPRFYRPAEVVNWMLRFPWVFSREAVTDDDRYYFSTTRELFTFKAFHIYEDDRSTPAGFTVVSILSHKQRTVVKLLDHCFHKREHEHMALVIALSCAKEFGADRIEYAGSLHRFMPTELTEQRLIKKQRRLFLYHPGAANSPLARGAEDIVLDYCDGDVAFA